MVIKSDWTIKKYFLNQLFNITPISERIGEGYLNFLDVRVEHMYIK